MSPCLYAFVASLLAAIVLVPLARRLALRFGVVDMPNEPRKVHTRAVPRTGGIAVCLAFCVGIAVLFLDPSANPLLQRDASLNVGFLLAAALITSVGAWDDARGLRYTQKFAGEIAVAVLLWGFGYRIQVLSMPWIGTVDLGLLSFPVTILWLVGVTNAVNLIDGLDGLAAGVSLFALGTVFVNGWLDGNMGVLLLVAALGGAVLGFLPYNAHPARIFLGDSGSLLLGSALGALSIRAYSKAPSTMALLAPVIMLGLPITDTVVAMLRRYLRGRSPFEADREHLHHRLLQLGLSQRGAVFALYGIALAFSALTLSLRGHSPARSAIGLGLGIALVLALLRALNYREVLHLLDGMRQVRVARARARERLLWLKEQRRLWRAVGSVDELWARLEGTRDTLGIAQVQLALDDARRFLGGPELPIDTGARAEFTLERGGVRLGGLMVAVAGHRTVLLEDERVVFEFLAEFVADALEDLAARTEAAQPRAQSGTLLGLPVVGGPTPTAA
jgi:UDP-GlcNAc:undecaprenyl-phosphate GlcNAc-1-phosphate transferase